MRKFLSAALLVGTLLLPGTVSADSIASIATESLMLAQAPVAVMGPAAVADSGFPAPFLEAWPILGVLLGTGAVLLAAKVVKSAVQWLKVRLRSRLDDVPHWLLHALNLTLSAGVGLLFVMEGRLGADPVFSAISWPFNWLIFTLAVFWRAGGKRDEEIEQAQELARARR